MFALENVSLCHFHVNVATLLGYSVVPVIEPRTTRSRRVVLIGKTKKTLDFTKTRIVDVRCISTRIGIIITQATNKLKKKQAGVRHI